MYIRVHVFPNQKKDGIEFSGQSKYIVRVREPAEMNRANMRMTELLASHFNITSNKVKIVSGHHESRKLVDIIGLDV